VADDLLGRRTSTLGPVAGAAEAYLDLANMPRYGMTERERSQLIGLLPGSPAYGAGGERYTSAALFARKNPFLAGLIGPANVLTDAMYGSKLRPVAERGAELGREMYASELGGGPGLADALEQEASRKKLGALSKQTGRQVPPELTQALLKGLRIR